MNLSQIATIVAAKSLVKSKEVIEAGTYDLDVTLEVTVRGTVTQNPEELNAATTSVPLLSVLALVLQKSGITREHSMRLLREALGEAMLEGKDKNAAISEHVKGMEEVIKIVKKEVIDQLPQVVRKGKLLAKDVDIDVKVLSSVSDAVEA